MRNKLIKIGLLINIVFIALAGSALAEVKDLDSVTSIYRVYNKVTGEHLFTPGIAEVGSLTFLPEWEYEGVAWVSPKQGEPVYRLFNTIDGSHLYTSSEIEISKITNEGWVIDNGNMPMFYSGGTKAVYRLFRPSDGARLLTTNENEYNRLGKEGWNQENIAFYAEGDEEVQKPSDS